MTPFPLSVREALEAAERIIERLPVPATGADPNDDALTKVRAALALLRSADKPGGE